MDKLLGRIDWDIVPTGYGAKVETEHALAQVEMSLVVVQEKLAYANSGSANYPNPELVTDCLTAEIQRLENDRETFRRIVAVQEAELGIL